MTKTIETATALTALEFQLMDLYAHCEMTATNGATPESAKDVWTYLWADVRAKDMGIDAKAVGGLLTSLASKGFAVVNKPSKGDKDGGFAFTDEGFAAWSAAREARNGGRPTTATEAMLDAKVTKVPAGLAVGAHGKDAVHSRKSLDDQRHPVKAPKDEPEVAVTKKLRAPKATSTAPKGNKLILKANAPVRAQLMALCKKMDGTRLQADGFASYTEFLGGIPLTNGAARVTLRVMKGKAVYPGKVIVLEVKDGAINVRKGG